MNSTSQSLESADRPWFAAQVWAGRERLCEEHLRARGYDVFLPRYRERRRWSDRVKTAERALFTGYVFCRVSPDVLGKIVTTPGVIRLVGDGNRPLPVAPSEIAALQRIVDTGLAAEPWEFVQAGQTVSVIDGPLCGLEGIVLRAHDRHRLIVSVMLLQRSVAVEIHPACIRVSPQLWYENVDQVARITADVRPSGR